MRVVSAPKLRVMCRFRCVTLENLVGLQVPKGFEYECQTGLNMSREDAAEPLKSLSRRTLSWNIQVQFMLRTNIKLIVIYKAIKNYYI